MPQLPAGFILDSKPNATNKTQGIAALPAGFVLDNKEQLSPIEEARARFKREVFKPIPLKNVARSGGRLVGDIANAVMNPIQTAKAVGNLAGGAIQNFPTPGLEGDVFRAALRAMPGGENRQKTLEGMGDFYKDRYGDAESTAETMYEDPVGFLSDVAIGTGALGVTAKATRIPSVAKAGEATVKFAQAVDPITQTARGVGGVIKGATQGRQIAPFARQVNPDVVKAAAEIGVDLPASAKTNSRIVPAVEAVVSKGLFGEDILKKIEGARVVLAKYADDLVASTGQAPDLVSAGKVISDGLDAYKTNFMKIKNDLYDKATIPSRASKGHPVVTVTPTKSLKYANEILNEKKRAAAILGKSEDISYFQSIRDKLITKDAPLKARDLQAAIKELNSKLAGSNDPIVTGSRGQLRKLTAMLSDDLDKAIAAQRPDLAQAIKEANKFYKDGISKLNSGYGEKIFRLAEQGQYDKILPAVMNKGTSIEDIPRLYELIGKKNVPGVQAALMEDIFSRAKNADGNVRPMGITQEVNRLGGWDKLKAMTTPEQFAAIKNIDTVSRSFSRLDKIADGSQTAFVGKLIGQATAGFINPAAGGLALGADFLASKAVPSQFGQKLMTTGLPLTPFTAAGERIIRSSGKIGTRGNLLRAGGIANQLEEGF